MNNLIHSSVVERSGAEVQVVFRTEPGARIALTNTLFEPISPEALVLGASRLITVSAHGNDETLHDRRFSWAGLVLTFAC